MIGKKLFGLIRQKTRYVILLISTLCLTLIWSNVLTFNFTIICMSPKLTNDTSVSNETRYMRCRMFFNQTSTNTHISANSPPSTIHRTKRFWLLSLLLPPSLPHIHSMCYYLVSVFDAYSLLLAYCQRLQQHWFLLLHRLVSHFSSYVASHKVSHSSHAIP